MNDKVWMVEAVDTYEPVKEENWYPFLLAYTRQEARVMAHNRRNDPHTFEPRPLYRVRQYRRIAK